MSELRQDLASGDWVIIAPGRAARPKFLDEKKKKRKPSPTSTCPFEDLHASGNWPPLLSYPDEKNWKIAVIANKYPAMTKSPVCSVPFEHGIYGGRTAIGSHELLITRDHNKNFADLDKKTAAKLFETVQAFHIMAAQDKCSTYVSTFCNWGPGAGASIWHPHYQILTLPIIPPHAGASLRGEAGYFKKHGRCVRCDIMKEEKREKVRIIEENKHGIAFAPYASKRPMQVSIFPKVHEPSFRDATPSVLADTAALLQSVMKRMRKYASDPDLNFFIHDAPLDGKDYGYHHWHIEVVPVNVISPPGGFEVSTIVNINAIDPDKAALILRGKKI